MPKISYTPKAKEGFDDAGVTALQIEQKIAEIQTLLRGLIDEDNLLAYNEDATAVNLPPSNVLDMPAETRPVNHSMKFFGKTGDHTDSIIETLYEESISLIESRPKIAMVNGILDKEIIIEIASSEMNPQVADQKSMEIEYPTYYVPMTYRDLWNVIKELKADIKANIESGTGLPWEQVTTVKVEGQITTLEEFMSSIVKTTNNPDDYVVEEYVNIAKKTASFNALPLDFDLTINKATTTLQVGVKDKAEGYLYRYTVSFMCRVNP
jgi:transcription termination factor NusB